MYSMLHRLSSPSAATIITLNELLTTSEIGCNSCKTPLRIITVPTCCFSRNHFKLIWQDNSYF